MNNTEHEYTAEEHQIMLGERLQSFGGRLSKLAGEQSAARSQIEQRWLQDIRQYHGEYTQEEQTKLDSADGSTVFVNKTRNKSKAAEARTQDMLFPTDDRNWGTKTTPVPEMSQQVVDGVDPEEDRRRLEEEAKKRAELMEKEIDDQLNEARYSIKARDTIHDSIQVGTGILKGPVVVGRVKRRWNTLSNGVSELIIEDSLEPSVERVDFWNFYPDMSATTIEDAEFVFERHLWSKRQLREFARLPGVIQGQLKELVRGDNDADHIAKSHINDIRAITGVDTVSDSNKYEVWEYHGPIKKAELLDAMESANPADFESDDYEDLDDELEAVVFFSAGRVLKVVLNPMETEDRPYSVFNWEKDESSIFGFGIPYLMRTAQRVINASYRMMMDNAGASVSDIIVVNKDAITPADGNWTMQAGKKKLYYLTDKNKTVRDAFGAFTIPNHQAALERIFMLANQLADEETNMPLIAQGEQAAHVTKTSSGMSMLMNSANIVLRAAVKNWDDDITRTLITRFYDWNMEHSTKVDIKGDVSIDARGSSVLLVREKQQENLMVYANISASNSELAIRRDWEGLDREMAKALEVPHEKLTLTDEEIQQRQQKMAAAQQQGDPAAEAKMAELQLKREQMHIDIQVEARKLAMTRELKLAEIASRENLTVEQLRTKVGLEELKEQTKRDIAAITANLSQTDLQLKAQNIAAGYDSHG